MVAAADWLERATDDDPLDRRHSMRLLRELDRELLADNTLTAVLALAPEADPARGQFAQALAGIEAALLAREARPEPGPVEHGGLRIARLRALVRLLDGVRRGVGEADLGPRLAAVRLLMARAAADHSSLASRGVGRVDPRGRRAAARRSRRGDGPAAGVDDRVPRR